MLVCMWVCVPSLHAFLFITHINSNGHFSSDFSPSRWEEIVQLSVFFLPVCWAPSSFFPQLWNSMCTFYIAWNFSSFLSINFWKICVCLLPWIFVGPLQIKGNCCCECWFFKYLINGYGGPPKHYFIPRTILFPDRFSGRNTQKSTRWCWGKSRQIIKLYL